MGETDITGVISIVSTCWLERRVVREPIAALFLPFGILFLEKRKVKEET